MKILYIYRHPKMGFSIGKVFAPIERQIALHHAVDSLYMPCEGYGVVALLRNITATLTKLRAKHYDIIHITGTENYLLPFIRGVAKVVTLHDVKSLGCEGGSLRSSLKRLLFLRTLPSADRITFISEASHKESEQLVKLTPDKCVVVPNPVDPSYSFTSREFHTLRPTILHIGTKPNKNLARTLQALSEVECRLRVVGRLTAEDMQLIERHNIDCTNLTNLSDEQILEEYTNCDIVSFPSTYEGFGMPIIEGQAVGRVVVTSALSPMREIANHSAVMVDPYSVESIREGFREAIAHHEEYVTRGLANIQHYQLPEVAQSYTQIYSELTIQNKES